MGNAYNHSLGIQQQSIYRTRREQSKVSVLTVAMVIAMSPSVTVSIGEDTMGVRRTMFLVTLVVKSTC